MYVEPKYTVKLAFAKSRIVHLGHAVVVGILEGDIELENVDYHKEVVVHYTTDGTHWKDVSAMHDKSLPQNKEVWKFSVPLGETPYKNGEFKSFNCSFAIRYTVAGQTCWDNNEDKNYHVSTVGQDSRYETITLGKPVHLFSVHGQKVSLPYHAVVSYFSGKVMTKDLGTGKHRQMEILYSIDGWESAKRFPAKFSRSKGYWEFSSPTLPASIHEASFLITYKTNDHTYIDDNYGERYVVYMR